MTTYIKENLQEIKSNISGAAKIAGKSDQEITLVAVTKYASIAQIKEIYKLGITEIGENKVQSALPKIEELEENKINWHFVGHLQSNKVKYLIDHIYIYQSLDRISLAKELNRRADRNNSNVKTLIQINIAGDDNKYGLTVEESEPFIEKILENYPRISINGLMTMIPFFYDPEEGRRYYARVKDLFDKLRDKFGKEYFQYLSMGMSHDYYIAIEEGANMVRIGRSLFNTREEGK